MLRHIVKEQNAAALPGAALSARQQAAQPAIGGAGRGIGEKRRGVLQDQPRADNKRDAAFLRRAVGADHTGKRVLVCDRDRRVAERFRRRHQLFGVGTAAQEGEIGGDVEFGIAGGRHGRGHGNTPCRNQRGRSSSGSR